MSFPAYSFNGNTVSVYGRLFFVVTSNSRKSVLHFVDLEGFEHWRTVCTCEAWRYGERPCRHINACLHAIASWAHVREDIREEWTDRLMFLLSMGHSFAEALASDSLTVLRSAPKPEPAPASRQYNLPVNPYDSTTATSQRARR